MVIICPKCEEQIPDDSIYCPYCAHGIANSARTVQVYAASLLMIITCTSSFIFIILSIRALLYISTWYPMIVAQSFYIYNQMLLALSICALISGGISTAISYNRLSYKLAITSAVACVLFGGCILTLALMVPGYPLWGSILFYFLPQFLPSLIGTILLSPRRSEFKQ
jgi:hypothetical protein